MEHVSQSNTKLLWRPDGYREELSYEEYKRYLINRAKELEPNFKMDDHFKKLIQQLSLYFFQDGRFESEGHGSLTKGICLAGNVGVGKTLLMNLFKVNAIKQMKVISTNKVSDYYQEHGIECLLNQFTDQDRSAYVSCYCFDDLGAERIPIKHMGNEINVLERIILDRYEKKKHNLTHFTTNLDGKGIEDLYGTRVRSRLKEMVNFFELGGVDRRK